MSVGRRTYTELVAQFFDAHTNTWFTIAEVAAALEISKGSARSACRALKRQGRLIESDDPAWAQRVGGPSGRLAFRTRAGYLPTSRFRQGDWVTEVIWVGEEPIIGPFCRHCGNPLIVHGPQRECLNYRIHPVLPIGDLPRAP